MATEIKVVDDFDDASVTEQASSEAEQANRTIDAREEKSKDRLNINRPPPQTTSWERDNKIMEEELSIKNKEKQREKMIGDFNELDIFQLYIFQELKR